jgi:hypothetical protein
MASKLNGESICRIGGVAALPALAKDASMLAISVELMRLIKDLFAALRHLICQECDAFSLQT